MRLRLVSGLLLLCAALVAGCPKRDSGGEALPASGDALPPTAAIPAMRRSADAGRAPRPGISERINEREALVRAIAREGIEDPRVLAAMRAVPRHRFVPKLVRELAYADRPLPIGNGQTISQPFIVAAMTQAADIQPGEKCLEIGTGSGYQAAVLAELCGKVYSIEYLPDVARFGAENLRAAGYGPDEVALRVGDGYRGWPEAAPFDVIIVTAAPDKVPQPLLDQLAVAGRLVIPIGPAGGEQQLERWTRVRPGGGLQAFARERIMGVQFVPFLGEGIKRQR